MTPNLTNWKNLRDEGRFWELKTSMKAALTEALTDYACLSLGKYLSESIYEFTLACEFAREADLQNPTTNSRLDLIESLIRIGQIDEASLLLESVPIDQANENRKSYLRGKIDGWACAKVGARIEYEGTDSSKPRVSFSRVYSARDEQHLLCNIIDCLGGRIEHFLVDVGASDGLAFSNTRHLLKCENWNGILIEPDKEKSATLLLNSIYEAATVSVITAYATSSTICKILDSHGCPHRPGFISIDIDSFDYPVLHSTLQSYRPSILCIEVNERVPPPVVFHVAEQDCSISPLLSGMSLSAATELLRDFQYRPVELHYNNLFAIPNEIFNQELNHRFPLKTDEELYSDGFLNKPDSFSVYPWNKQWKAIIDTGLKDPLGFSKLFKSIIAKNSPEMTYVLAVR